jgi:hypothetical protein
MSNNPFRKQAGGKLSAPMYAAATVALLGAIVLGSHLIKHTPAEAPYGYLAVDLAYVDGKFAQQFVIDANADLETCRKEDQEVAEQLLSDPDAPQGVRIVGECYAMPATPAAAPPSSAPKPAPALKPHVGEQGGSQNSQVI